ncbi:MAG: LysR family transcriptional regulator [Myxococcales bacterium]|nr:LysR family transcriptional regulator [Myxococcales bacterium]
MDLDSVRCFEVAATTLNFRAASARVYLSPAAFSDRLRRLEEELGAVLFERTTRKVVLSEAGRRLLPLARELLEGEARLKAVGREPEKAAPFELFVGTRYELGVSWLCPALKDLERRRPERTVHLYNGDTPDLLQRLERGDVDAIVASMRLTSPNLTYAALHPEEYVLVSARPGLRRRPDASVHTLVDVSRDLPLFRYFLDALPDAEPWPFAKVEYLGGIGNIRRRLLDGEGRVAVLPRYFCRDDLTAKRLVRLLPSVRLRSDSFRLVWRRNHPREAELLEVAAALRAHPLK